MLKITLLLICFIALTTEEITKKPSKQEKFNSDLETLHKKLNGTKFPEDQTVDRTKCKSNMRKTSEQAKTIHEIYTFAKEFVANDSISKRSTDAVGYTINSTYCPFQNQKIVCNSSNIYRNYDGTCNNLVNPLIGTQNTPYIRLLSPSLIMSLYLSLLVIKLCLH